MYTTTCNVPLNGTKLSPKMKNGKITLGLVDDHQIVIDGLTSLLKGHEKFNFAFATTDSVEVIEKMNDLVHHALKKKKLRIATKANRAAREKRLESKKKLAEIKSGRKKFKPGEY